MVVRSRRLLVLALLSLAVAVPQPATAAAGEPPPPVVLPADDAMASISLWRQVFARVGDDPVVVVRSEQAFPLTTAIAQKAGVDVVELASGDPRAEPTAVPSDSPVIAAGMPPGFAYTLDVVGHDVQQPTGGYLAVPGKHYTAMYGHPGAPQLGVLGEQGVGASVKRAELLAAKYRRVAPDVDFVPTFEIIATVASSGAGKDKDYSREASMKDLLPLVDAAEKAGIYVILDLQPGRTDFLTQAKRYEPLLRRPHVGLALDPEWRLKKKQKHLEQIGSVQAAEVNRTSAWLATLTRHHRLPQKLFVLHQFSTSMIKNRAQVDTSHPELATIIHVDGSGPQGAKQGTWAHLKEKPPAGLAGWGWKNFVDEDDPMLNVVQTWKRVKPHPVMISYQ